MPDPITRYYTVGDTAHELRCSPRRVQQLADSGELPTAGRTDRGWRLFNPVDVDRYRRDRDAKRTAAA